MLTALDAKVTVVEGHSFQRNDGSREITPLNSLENRCWIKEQDELFLEQTGIVDILKQHDVEYLNVTEEY